MRTTLQYYFIAAQSFLPDKKNDITFDSHYVTYLNAANEEVDMTSLPLWDKETSIMHIVVKGKTLFSDDAFFYYGGSFSVARNDAIIWAKEEDGCPE